jgi:hypothetical protein
MPSKRKPKISNCQNTKKPKINYSEEINFKIKIALEKLFHNKAITNKMPFLFSALQTGSQDQLKRFFENNTDQIWYELKKPVNC